MPFLTAEFILSRSLNIDKNVCHRPLGFFSFSGGWYFRTWPHVPPDRMSFDLSQLRSLSRLIAINIRRIPPQINRPLMIVSNNRKIIATDPFLSWSILINQIWTRLKIFLDPKWPMNDQDCRSRAGCLQKKNIFQIQSATFFKYFAAAAAIGAEENRRPNWNWITGQ